jgi:hypothetical protein
MHSRTRTRTDWRRTRTALPAVLAAALLAATVLAACGDDQPAAPVGEPSITGVVAAAAPADGSDPVSSFLIDQGSGDYDKASVTVTDDTGWYRRTTDGYETIARPSVGELTGKTVEVQFTGAVAESYPVQATAGWVIVGDDLTR